VLCCGHEEISFRETANSRMLKRTAGAAPGGEAEEALPGQMSHYGKAAIRWEKVLDVGLTEPGNVTQEVTVSDNSGGR
jgi:hypothetical protein